MVTSSVLEISHYTNSVMLVLRFKPNVVPLHNYFNMERGRFMKFIVRKLTVDVELSVTDEDFAVCMKTVLELVNSLLLPVVTDVRLFRDCATDYH